MSLHVVDGKEVVDAQWVGYCADDEQEQRPMIRATFHDEYPFCVTTPGGEPIRAYKQHKHASMALSLLEQEFAS